MCKQLFEKNLNMAIESVDIRLADFDLKINTEELCIMRLLAADFDNKLCFSSGLFALSLEEFKVRVENLCKKFYVNDKYELLHEASMRKMVSYEDYTLTYRRKVDFDKQRRYKTNVLYPLDIKILKAIKINDTFDVKRLLCGYYGEWTSNEYLKFIQNKLNLSRRSFVIPVLIAKGVL